MEPKLPTLDARKLMYFASIIEHGSFKRAAKDLRLSQPALSTSMDRLEAELGLKLLERGPKGTSPTLVGSNLYSQARVIRDEIDSAMRALTDAQGSHAEPLRVGALPSLASSILPAALGRWRATYQHERIEVSENVQIHLLLGVLRHDFDLVFGFTECYELEDGLRQRVLFRDTLCVVARPSHPLSIEEDLDWRAVAAYPWIFPTARRPHTILDAALRAAGVAPPSQATVCSSVSIIKALVAESDHLAMVPAHAIRLELAQGRLISLPIRDEQLDRNIAVFFREGHKIDESSRHLIDVVKAVGTEYSRTDPVV